MKRERVQWGSEIRPSLDLEWSKRGWVANGVNVTERSLMDIRLR